MQLKEKASDLFSGLLQKGADVLVGKRSIIGDHLSKIGNFVSGAVAPFKDVSWFILSVKIFLMLFVGRPLLILKCHCRCRMVGHSDCWL